MWRVALWDRDRLRRETWAQALRLVDRHPILVDDVADLQTQAASADADLIVLVDPDDDSVEDWRSEPTIPHIKRLAVIDITQPDAIWRAVQLRADRVLAIDRPAPQAAEAVQQFLTQSAEQDAASAWPSPPANESQALLAVLRGVCDEMAELQRRFESELSERKRVEQALQESEAFYQSLVATLPLAMFRKDQQGRITFVNKVLCEAMRRPASQIIGRTDYDFFPVELAEKYRADDRRVMETRQDFETIEEFLTPTGETRILHSLKAPVYDAAGQLVGIQGIFTDITDQRRAELALEQERSRLDSLMQNLPDLIWFKDARGHYLRVNPALAKEWNLSSPHDAIGRTDAELFDAEYAWRSREHDRQVLATGQSLVAQVEYMTFRNGRSLWMSTTKLPLIDNHGEIVGTFGVARNISQMKQTQEALQHAKDAAEAANRAKSDFLANMSHEIRTPLNSVIGVTDLLLEHESSSSQREYLRMVRDAGESLLAIVEDILDFSKIEAGRLKLEELEFSLRDVVGNTMKSLALRAHHKRLELACHIGLDIPDDLCGDPMRLRQVLFNLVGNAIKFTEHGEVLLDVCLEDATDQDVKLHFVVHDTGIGVPAEKLADIFRPFVQADTSTTRRYGGTGLGLGISSRLVEMMQGKIWVESLEQLGSHFHFTVRFPRAIRDAVPQQIVPAHLNGMRILVVDDNATSRGILVEILTAWGLQALVASGTAEALVALESLAEEGTPCGLVLVDSHMPGEDGFQLAARLKQQPQLCPHTLVMLTSGDRPDEIARCQRLGVSGYVIKPVKQSELFEAVVSATSEFETKPTPLPPTRITTQPRRILLVEDSPMNQKLAVGLLERWGHSVTVADNGLEAVSILRDHSFDVVLMDVQMPEMDGLEATRVIRREEQAFDRRRTPIIAMTAHAMTGDRERCLAAGMDEYVMKPIRAENLFRVLEDADVATAAEPATSASSQQLTDLSAARAAVNDDRDLLREIIGAFLEEAPALVEQLAETFAHARWKDARRMAHTLKGGLLTFGAQTVAEQASAFEQLAKSQTPVDDERSWQTFAENMQSVFGELQGYLKSRGNGGNMAGGEHFVVRSR